MKELVLTFLKQKCFMVTMLFCFVLVQQAHAQEQTVTGSVTGPNSVPIPGASVQVKGTDTGVATDFDGNFEISVSDANAVLIFSYVGFTTTEVPLNNQNTLHVTLEEDVASLDEVVVTGYGTARREEITSSITRVDAEEFNKGNVNSPEQLLQGKVAGLNIAKAGGDPNQPFVIRLRGLSTMGANAQPLVVIDGVVGASLETVDPNDVESISVLKDASAGAIYGTRGSSGVIIVTTKDGSGTTEPSLEYRGYAAVESISNVIPVANREEFLAAVGADLGADTNWLDQVSEDGISHVHNVSYANSTADGLNYRASINYRDVGGVLKNTGFEQLNARLNISQRLLNDRLKLTSIVSVSDRKSNLGFAQAMRFALNFIPTAPIYETRTADQLGRSPDLYGGYYETGVQDVFNPVAINNLSKRERNMKAFLANFQAEFEVLEGLKLGANYSTQNNNLQGGEYFPSTALWGGASENGVASRFNDQTTDNLIELTTNFTSTVGDFKYDLLGGLFFPGHGFRKHVYLQHRFHYG